MIDLRRKITVAGMKNITRWLLISLAIFGGVVGQDSLRGDSSDSPRLRVENSFREWKKIALSDSLTPERRREKYTEAVRQLFALDNIARKLLAKHWEDISPGLRNQVGEALAVSIVKEILANPYMSGISRESDLLLVKNQVKKYNATLDYQLNHQRQKTDVRIFMSRDAEGVWKITDLKMGKKSLIRHFYQICSKLVDNYSVPYLIAELTGSGYVVLEDFEDAQPDTLPPLWGWKKKDNDKRKPYIVREEDGNKYLEATDRGESVIFGKPIKWNLKKYRYISFRWRAHRLPEGGDERYGKTVDSAAGIYFTYKKKLGLIPVSVKYVWSTTLPVGSTMIRNGIGKPWTIVAESGDEHLGEWRTFVFDLWQAYKDTFGGDPPDTAIGIGILSDANSTHSFAYADYDDIRALMNAEAESGVRKILEAE